MASGAIPLFSAGVGLVLRPSATRAFCGFSSDMGGHGNCRPLSYTCVPGCVSNEAGRDEWCHLDVAPLHPANHAAHLASAKGMSYV